MHFQGNARLLDRIQVVSVNLTDHPGFLLSSFNEIGNPSFSLKGSFTGDIDMGIDIDVIYRYVFLLRNIVQITRIWIYSR